MRYTEASFNGAASTAELPEWRPIEVTLAGAKRGMSPGYQGSEPKPQMEVTWQLPPEYGGDTIIDWLTISFGVDPKTNKPARFRMMCNAIARRQESERLAWFDDGAPSENDPYEHPPAWGYHDGFTCVLTEGLPVTVLGINKEVTWEGQTRRRFRAQIYQAVGVAQPPPRQPVQRPVPGGAQYGPADYQSPAQAPPAPQRPTGPAGYAPGGPEHSQPWRPPQAVQPERVPAPQVPGVGPAQGGEEAQEGYDPDEIPF